LGRSQRSENRYLPFPAFTYLTLTDPLRTPGLHPGIVTVSEKKLAANRANALKSTGPRTEAGRQKVSQNRTKHGLCGDFTVPALYEDQAVYDDLLERFMQAEQPADDVERELVAKMARHTWLSKRALTLQEACFLFQPQTEDQKARNRQAVAVMKDIYVYLRYQAHHDRAYQRAAAELAKRRKDRLSAAVGFESQKRAKAEEKRREKREIQRDELHFYKVATAKRRLSVAKAPSPIPKTGQTAA
jgi:hypothetical protein